MINRAFQICCQNFQMCCQGFDEALGTAFKKFIYQIIVFDSILEKTCTLMSILEQKLRKVNEKLCSYTIKKGDTSIMLGTVNIFYGLEIEYVISKFLIFMNIVQSKCVRCATYQPINNEMVNKYHSMDCLSLVFRAVIDASHVTVQNK